MYLVTGGAGFIGSNIVRRLVALGERVRVLDDFSTGKKENLAGIDGVEVIEGSLLDLDCVKKAVNSVEYILHQGAVSSITRSLEEPALVNENNINGTLNLLIAIKNKPLKRLVFAASCSVYKDNHELPIDENAAINPLSIYAASKYTGELHTRIFSHNYGLPTVSLRYFNVYGPYQDPSSDYAAVIPRFILKMLRDENPLIYGDGEQTRDFVYVDDVVEANLLACRSNKLGGGEVINIAGGESNSLNKLVSMLNEHMGKNIKPEYAEARQGDVKHSLADIAKARELLGYNARVDFREGLERTVEWFRV